MIQKKFKGGIHPNAHKELSENAPIEMMSVVSSVAIPVAQHIGKPAIPVVAKGDKVKKGQLIASADGVISANIYSSVSGEVTDIVIKPTPTGACAHIVIANDGLEEEVRLAVIENPDQNSVKERLVTAGIVGMGGAGFPTGVKVSPKTPAECLLINGAECEPYVTCDTRVMVERTAEFVDGVKLLMIASGVDKGYIAIEDNKPQAISSVVAYIKDNDVEGVEVVPLKTHYPQGSEKHIIKSVTGKTVPLGSLPISVGVIVDNVHTALSTHYAVREGKPLYERVTTVTGGGINTPKNLWIKTGTSYADLIAYCDGEKENTVKLISGGPMMGFAVSGAEYSATKTTGCVLLLTNAEAETTTPGPCINCGRCQRVCPMRLMPMFMDAHSQNGDLDGAVKYGLNACIECGSCSFVCPAKRTLVQSFKLAKRKLRERK